MKLVALQRPVHRVSAGVRVEVLPRHDYNTTPAGSPRRKRQFQGKHWQPRNHCLGSHRLIWRRRQLQGDQWRLNLVHHYLGSCPRVGPVSWAGIHGRSSLEASPTSPGLTLSAYVSDRRHLLESPVASLSGVPGLCPRASCPTSVPIHLPCPSSLARGLGQGPGLA